MRGRYGACRGWWVTWAVMGPRVRGNDVVAKVCAGCANRGDAHAENVVIPAHARTQGSAPRSQRTDAPRCTDHHQPEFETEFVAMSAHRPSSSRRDKSDPLGGPCRADEPIHEPSDRRAVCFQHIMETPCNAERSNHLSGRPCQNDINLRLNSTSNAAKARRMSSKR